MYYDQTLPNPVPITNNTTHDRVPQIHNGQVAWIGTTGVFMATVTPTASGFALETLDGSDFSTGTEVSSDSEVLALGGAIVEGAVTDGVTRLLLRVDVPAAGGVTFTLNGTGNPNEDGVFRSIDGLQTGSTITVNSVTTSQGEQAFAIYQAPENFVRAGSRITDGIISERTLPIRVELTSGAEPPIDTQLRLMRPPLILVHGLWSSSGMWTDFYNQLINKIPGLYALRVNYEATNDRPFLENKNVVREGIDDMRDLILSNGIAMVQADVMGHSMGGILSRIHYGGNFWPDRAAYARNSNFQMGDINKFISLDSVHYGSFLADFAIDFGNGLPFFLQNAYLAMMRSKSQAIDEGAVEELGTLSQKILYMNNRFTTPNPPSHTIVGDYVFNGDLADVGGEVGVFYSTLKSFGVDTTFAVFVPGESDLVVSAESQAGGMGVSATTIMHHNHTAATTQEVVNRTFEILNATIDSSLFENGFPINTYDP